MHKIVVIFLLLWGTLLCAQNPNDCENALILCGNSNLGLDPSGVGMNEFSLPGNNTPSCYAFNNNTIWLKFEIIGDGNFTFDLIPSNGTDDYDFAIFGPSVTCTTLGDPIRCSSTNPQNAGVSANTGLNMTETDVTEGPGADGNGYLMFIDAQAGDSYYLLVDRAIGSEGFDIIYTGTATLPNSVIANSVPDQVACDSDGTQDGATPFDLDALSPTIIGTQTGAVVSYHLSLNDANIGINALPNPYTNISNPQTIFARIENSEGCNDTTSFTISIGNPSLTTPNDVGVCSEMTSENYNLDSLIPEVIVDPTGYDITYHTSQNDADLNINPIGPIITITETVQTIYMRVTDVIDNACYSTVFFDIHINLIQQATQPTHFVICDDDFDGFASFDLTIKDAEILGTLPAAQFEVYYYVSENDRLTDTNRITSNFTNTSNPQTIYASLYETATQCFSYTRFELMVQPIPDPQFEQDPYELCLNLDEPAVLTVQDDFAYYVWSTGEEGAHLNSIDVSAIGTYSVTVTNELGCTNSQSVQVIGSEEATIIDIVVVDFNFPDNRATVLVEGIGDYEFSVDDEFAYQESNEFNNLLYGYHTFYVRDKNGCGVVARRILILDYPRMLTPNNDGYHDTWHITGLESYPDAVLHIYDRYGKLLKSLTGASEGWDGTYNGAPLASNDYWFTLMIDGRKQIRGHFTLKR